MTTLVDSENKLASLFGFNIVPNGIVLDEEGRVRLVKQGFSVNNEDHVNAVKQIVTDQANTVTLDDEYHVQQRDSTIERQLAETKFKLAHEYLQQDRKEEALKELDEALKLDPENFLIRKQRWYIRHPERFSPTIDIAWQQEQLEKEKAEEERDCGPDGCRIPGTS